MAVEDDAAWAAYKSALDEATSASAYFDALRHLPKGDEFRDKAAAALKNALATLNKAASKIEPAFKR